MVAFFMAINVRNGKQLVFSVWGQTVKAPFVMWSSSQATKTIVQNILTPVAAVTTAPMAVTTPCTPGMKLWYTNNSPFTSYTTLTPHSDSRSDFSTYVTSHVHYTYV